jgi:hypothetical protein
VSLELTRQVAEQKDDSVSVSVSDGCHRRIFRRSEASHFERMRHGRTGPVSYASLHIERYMELSMRI